MSVDEFMNELGKALDLFDWIFEPDTSAGSERRDWPRFWIMGSAKEGPAEGIKVDPVEAVGYALTGTFSGQKHWKGAAQTIGLSPIDAESLIAASKDRTWRDRDGRRRPDEDLQSLRLRLLKVIAGKGGRFRLG